MRKSATILFLICGGGQLLFGGGFYNIDHVHIIKIYFAQANWDNILDSLYARGREERLAGTVFIDGVRYDSVGVRYKGHSSYHPDRVKTPLNIKLDYIIKEQTINGYGTLRLANNWHDPSCVREVLGYEIARKYMPAPQADYADVYINDELVGLYVNVQDIDKLFTQAYFGKGRNVRFKGEFINGPQGHDIWGYQGQDSARYRDLYKLESASGWTELIAFLDTLNNYPANVSRVLNIDRHLWTLAYDNLLVNLDAPINAAHNYYLYRDNAGRFNPIVWDLHMIFGGYTLLVSENRNLSVGEMQRLDPFLNAADPSYPAISKILNNVEYRKMYVAHMKTIMKENFSNDWYLSRAHELQNIIDRQVRADSQAFYPYDDFHRNLNDAIGSDSLAVVGIAQLMAERIAYISALPEFCAQAPVITDLTYIPAIVKPHSEVQIRVNVRHANVVRLAFRHGSAAAFETCAMLDSGGDGVYSASIPVKTDDVHYYIYAENDKAAAFMPERAEYEDSVIAVTSSPASGRHKKH